MSAIEGGELGEREEGVVGRADQERVTILKSHVSLSTDDGDDSPEQMNRLPCGSGSDEALAIKEGILAIVAVSCSPYDA